MARFMKNKSKSRKKKPRVNEQAKCRFCREKISEVDYKDIPGLIKLTTPQGKLFSRKRSGKLLALTVLATLVMAALFSVALFANAEELGLDDEGARDHRPPREGPGAPPEADTDGDGEISEEEHAAWMATIDTDGDGEITREEMEAHRELKEEEKFNELDTDGDGYISQEEHQALVEEKLAEMEERALEKFDEMDTDDDGVITPEERPEKPEERPEKPGEGERPGRRPHPPREGGQTKERMKENIDTDGDGNITLEELTAHIETRNAEVEEKMNQHFDEMDTDDDGKVSLEEAKAWAEEHRKGPREGQEEKGRQRKGQGRKGSQKPRQPREEEEI